MSDPNVTATPVAPAVTVDPGTGKPAPAAAPPPAPPAPAGEPEEKPSWLNARLERERRSLLKEMGVENVDDAKKALADLKAKQDAEKTSAQKAAELAESLKASNAEKASMAEALGVYAKAQLAGLTEVQRSAVTAIAGEDPAKQLKTIEQLRPTWGAAPAAPTQAPAAPAPPPKPADTAPAPSAPKDGPATSPPDPKAVYAELKKTNPVIAARYALANGVHDHT